MDATIVIATIMMLAIAGIVALMRMSANRRNQNIKKRIQLQISDFERLNHVSMHTTDFFGHKAICIDTEKKYLLFVDGQGIPAKPIATAMAHVSGAEVAITAAKNGTLSAAGTLNEHTAYIHLLLKLKSGEVVRLPFYNEIEDGPSERDELHALCKKWQLTIMG